MLKSRAITISTLGAGLVISWLLQQFIRALPTYLQRTWHLARRRSSPSRLGHFSCCSQLKKVEYGKYLHLSTDCKGDDVTNQALEPLRQIGERTVEELGYGDVIMPTGEYVMMIDLTFERRCPSVIRISSGDTITAQLNEPIPFFGNVEELSRAH